MSSNLHRNSTEANKHTPKGFDLANNNSTLLRDERGQSRYVDNLVQERAENLVNGNSAPPTTTEGHVYVLIDNGSGAVHVDWQGADYNDVVRIQGGVWSAITPVNGYLVFNKTDGKYYAFNGSTWVQFIPDSQNIYTNNGTTGSNRTVTITDVLNFNGGKVALNSTTAGFLMPRVTTLQMNAISTPSTNELVFNTDLNGIYRYNGSSWVALSSGYGIIGVYSGSGNGTPVFFADLQSALETCKASGGYFTVKLYSNITITSSILIDYTGSGVGGAYLFRQLTIDFNGFSVTNAEANDSHALTVRLSNNISVYQELIMSGGVVNRLNGTGTHYALNMNTATSNGSIKMSKMLFYNQNGIAAIFNQAIANFDKFNDFGGSVFISQNSTAISISNSTMKFTNFKAISNGGLVALSAVGTEITNFIAENTSTGNAVFASGGGAGARLSNFKAYSNSGIAVDLALGVLNNFKARSISGKALEVRFTNGNYVNDFEVETGNNTALNVVGGTGHISNGRCINNSASATAICTNFGTINNVEAINYGSGVGLQISITQVRIAEITNCRSLSIGGIGSSISNTDASARLNIDNCFFSSAWENAGGHGLTVTNSLGVILLTKSHMRVANSGANAIHATAPRTVNSRYCTHNDVASTPINANVTIVSSGIIS